MFLVGGLGGTGKWMHFPWFNGWTLTSAPAHATSVPGRGYELTTPPSATSIAGPFVKRINAVSRMAPLIARATIPPYVRPLIGEQVPGTPRSRTLGGASVSAFPWAKGSAVFGQSIGPP